MKRDQVAVAQSLTDILYPLHCRLNADPELNPYTPKKKLIDGHDLV